MPKYKFELSGKTPLDSVVSYVMGLTGAQVIGHKGFDDGHSIIAGYLRHEATRVFHMNPHAGAIPPWDVIPSGDIGPGYLTIEVFSGRLDPTEVQNGLAALVNGQHQPPQQHQERL